MMLVEETSVPSSALPVAVFKEHLRLGSGFPDEHLQDGLLEAYLRAALVAIEARTSKITIERQFTLSLRAWRNVGREWLPIAPVSEILEVAVIDRTGVVTIADPVRYVLEPDMQCPSMAAPNGCLPSIPTGGSARVTLRAGFGATWEDLPADLAQAALILGAHYYEFRHEAVGGGGELPFAVNALIARHRPIRLGAGGRF